MIPKKPVVVITGASRGIGNAVALHFAKKGARLALSCHSNKAMLDNTCASIRSMGCDCITYAGDMSVSADVNAFHKMVKEHYGTVDVLINNAGISYVGLLTDMSDDDWDNTIGTNLNSVFYNCRNVIPGMVNKQSGCIINVSSVWGDAGASCEVAYSASKGAVNAFTKALAKELAPSGVQVNAVACGLIDTSMNSHLTKEEMEALCDEIPAGRAGTVSEVAKLIYDICAQSPYLTGQIIKIDGGWI